MATDRVRKDPTPSALRMRRYRQRRDEGSRTYPIEIHESTVDFLVEQGLLRHEERDDKDQVAHALVRFLQDAMQQEQQLGRCAFDLSAKQIDQLVKFNLLDPKARTDSNRVRVAFADFVRWAFWRRQTSAPPG